MKKRVIKDTEERLLSQTEVSDGVLDSARAELEELRRDMVSKGGAASPVPASVASSGRGAATQTVSRRVAVIAAACLLVAVAVVLIIIFAMPKSNFSNEPVYVLSELEEREIGSVAQYNAEYGTDYLCASGGVQGCAYSDGSRDVLLKEGFAYDGSDCLLYVLTDASGNSVDILQSFYQCAALVEVEGNEVYYDAYTCGLAYFYGAGSAYFLSVEEGGYELLLGVLGYLIVG